MTKPVIETYVGHAAWEENFFCGYKMHGDLVGKEDGFWSMVSLAVGGKRLSKEQTRILDDLSLSFLSADPRIWPPKVARLIASYGTAGAGFAASYIAFDRGAAFGNIVGEKIAALLVSIQKKIENGSIKKEQLPEVIGEILDKGEPIAGFGVPLREKDERVLAIKDCLKIRGFDKGPYWTLLLEIEKILFERKKIRLNGAGAMIAVCLDLGFNLSQVKRMTPILMTGMTFANSVEGADQCSPLLQNLPIQYISYKGPAQRMSPRAKSTGKVR